MKHKIENISNSIVSVVKSWDNVEAVALCETRAGESWDPHFFASFDVYTSGGTIPPADERCKAFSFGNAFEGEDDTRKDRFLAGDIPVRIEYRDTSRMQDAVDGKSALLSIVNGKGTYPFGRLQNSVTLYDRSGWLDRMRAAVGDLPLYIWKRMRDAAYAKLEHHCADLAAATMSQDEGFFLLAQAGFLRDLSTVVFSVNRRFEPSQRFLMQELAQLQNLPDTFMTNVKAFVAANSSLSLNQKKELAVIMTKMLLHFE